MATQNIHPTPPIIPIVKKALDELPKPPGPQVVVSPSAQAKSEEYKRQLYEGVRWRQQAENQAPPGGTTAQRFRYKLPNWVDFNKSKVSVLNDGRLHITPDADSLKRYASRQEQLSAAKLKPAQPLSGYANIPIVSQAMKTLGTALSTGEPTVTKSDDEVTLDQNGGFTFNPGELGTDWGIEYKVEKGKRLRQIKLYANELQPAQPTETGTPGAGQQFGLPEGDPDKTLRGGFAKVMSNPFVQLGEAAISGGGPAALVGAAIGGPVGAAIGGAIGTGAMLIKAEQDRQMAERSASAEELAAAQREFNRSIPGAALIVLNAPAETAKRAIGVGTQGIAAAINPEQYGFDKSKTFAENFSAAWDAAQLTYTATPIDVRGVFGVQHLADRLTKGGPVYPIIEDPSSQFVDWDTGPAPMPGVNALAWARQRILEGQDPEQVKALVAGSFGAPGQIRDLTLNIVLDPLNFVGKFQREGLKLYAKYANDAGMAKALSQTPSVVYGEKSIFGRINRLGVRAAEAVGAERLAKSLGSESRVKLDLIPFPTVAYEGGLIKTLEIYKNTMLSEIPFRHDFVAKRDLNLLSRILLSKTIVKLAEGAGYEPPKWYQLNRLEPVSEAKSLMEQGLNFYQSHLNSRLDVNDPSYVDNITAAVKATISGRVEDLPANMPGRAAYADMQNVLEGKVYRQVLGESESYDELIDGYRASRPHADMISDVADTLKITPQDVFDRIKENPDGVLAEYATSTGRPIKIGENEIDGKGLQAIRGLFRESDAMGRRQAFNAQEYQAAIFSRMFENAGKWAAITFKVQPPGMAQRLAGAVKSIESTLLMAPNLGYLVNNVFNGEVTMMARGVWGITNIRAGVERMRSMGLDPARLRSGIGAAELADLHQAEFLGERAYKAGESALLEGFSKDDALAQITRLGNSITAKMPTATAMAQKVERWQSTRAVVKGFFDFHASNWRKGKGIDVMEPALEASLKGFGIDPAWVYAAVEAGANPREINAAVFGEAPKPVMQQFIAQTASDLGMPTEQIVDLFKIDGLDRTINDELGKLPAKPTEGHIRKAFDAIKAAGEKAVHEAARDEATQYGQHAMEVIKAGDVGAALDSIDDIETRLFDTYAETMSRHDVEWERINKQGNKGIRDLMKQELSEQDDASWKTYFDYEDAVYRGIDAGMKDSGLELSDNWLTAARKKRESVQTFIDERNKIRSEFFGRPERQADEEWVKVQEQINALYQTLADDTYAIALRTDVYMTAEFARAFGDETGTAFNDWRNSVREFNKEDMAAVARFRESIKNIKSSKEKSKRWLAFNAERTAKRREIMIRNIEARHRVMDVMPIKPSAEVGMRNAEEEAAPAVAETPEIRQETATVSTAEAPTEAQAQAPETGATDFETLHAREVFDPSRVSTEPTPIHIPTPLEVLPEVNATRAEAGLPPHETPEAIPLEELIAAQNAQLAKEMFDPYAATPADEIPAWAQPTPGYENLPAELPPPSLATIAPKYLKEAGWTRGRPALLLAVNKDRLILNEANSGNANWVRLDPYLSMSDVPILEATQAMNVRLEDMRTLDAAKSADLAVATEAQRLAERVMSATEDVTKVVQQEADLNVAKADLLLPVPSEVVAPPAPWTRQRYLDEVVTPWFDTTSPDYADQVEAAMALTDAHAQVWANVWKKSPDEWYGLQAGGVTEGGRSVQGELFQRAGVSPVWYSVLERTLDTKMANRMPADQLRKMLTGASVKPDEMKWSGFDEWLGQQAGPVSKADALAFVRESNVQLKEVTLSGSTKVQIDAAMEDYDRVALENGIDSNTANKYLVDWANDRAPLDSLPEPIRAAADRLKVLQAEYEKGYGGQPKYETYTLPGGENYREVLLTLPEIGKITFEEWVKEKFGNFIVTPDNEPLLRSQYNSRIERTGIFAESPSVMGKFNAPHFGPQGENLLAHFRLDDRIDADGKRVLFVEEIQSDWHQAGREKGYRVDTLPDTFKVVEEKDGTWSVIDKNGNTRIDVSAETRDAAISLALKELNGNAIPQAPWSKTWQKMAFRRITRMAAEEGYDKIAWTTGAQQSERYNLAKQIDTLSFEKRSNGEVNLVGVKDNRVIVDRMVPQDELSGMVGQDLAKRITEYPDSAGEIGAEGLTVGGEGMKGFYDDILPKYADKFGKKFGAQTGEEQILADVAKYEIDNIGGNDPWRLRIYNEDGSDNVTFHKTREEAQVGISEYATFEPVHSLDITPAMKESVLREGVALFQEQPGTRQPKAAFELLDNWQRTVTGFASRDVTSFVHETSHGFLYDLFDASKVDEQARADVADYTSWLQTKRDIDVSLVDGRLSANSDRLPKDWRVVEDGGQFQIYNGRDELLARGTDRADTIRNGLVVGAQEDWARGFERFMADGYAPTPELRRLFERFKKWIVQVYQRITGTDIDIEITPEMRGVYERLLVQTEPAYPLTDMPHTLRPDQMLVSKELAGAYFEQYVAGEAQLMSSRTNASTLYERMTLRPGQWVQDEHGGSYGHEIEQVRLVDPNTLQPTEHIIEQGYEGRSEDAARYAQWLQEGKNAPPIAVVQHVDGQYVVTNGHRRLASAKSAGFPVLAQVSPLMDTGMFDSAGKPIRTGMTYEGALVWAYKRGEAVDMAAIKAMQDDVANGKYPYLKNIAPDLFTGPDVSDSNLIGAVITVSGLDTTARVIKLEPRRARLITPTGQEVTVPKSAITAVAHSPAEIEALRPELAQVEVTPPSPEQVRAASFRTTPIDQLVREAATNIPASALAQRGRKTPAGQTMMFGNEELPLFSGTAPAAVEQAFVPREVAPNEVLPGISPVPEFGQTRPVQAELPVQTQGMFENVTEVTPESEALYLVSLQTAHADEVRKQMLIGLGGKARYDWDAALSGQSKAAARAALMTALRNDGTRVPQSKAGITVLRAELAKLAGANDADTMNVQNDAVYRWLEQKYSQVEVNAEVVSPKKPWEMTLDEFGSSEYITRKPENNLIEYAYKSGAITEKITRADTPENLEKIYREVVETAPSKTSTDEAAQTEVVAPVPIAIPAELRVENALRRSLAEMDETDRAEAINVLREKILVNPVSGAPSISAYSIAPKKSIQVHSDVDGLKWINDTFGHGAGDELLKAKAHALRDEGIDAYHIGGDEFYSQFDTAEEAQAAMERARARLNKATVTWVNPDGSTHTFEGVRFTYGTGTDGTSAEAGLSADKLARVARGERSERGDKPAGLVERVEGQRAGETGRPLGGGLAGKVTPDEVVAPETVATTVLPDDANRAAWNALDIEQRRALAKTVYGNGPASRIARSKWDDLGGDGERQSMAEVMQAEKVVTPAPVEEIVAPAAALSPWQIPRLEYIGDSKSAVRAHAHYLAVEEALKLGLDVPDEVKADYPDLVESHKPKAPEVTAPATKPLPDENLQRGTRVSYVNRKGETLTGSVDYQFDNEVTVKVDQMLAINTRGGQIPIGRVETWPLEKLEIIERAEPLSPLEAAQANLPEALPVVDNRPLYVRNNKDIGKVALWREDGVPVVEWSSNPSKPYPAPQWKAATAQDFTDVLNTNMGSARKASLTEYANDFGWSKPAPSPVTGIVETPPVVPPTFGGAERAPAIPEDIKAIVTESGIVNRDSLLHQIAEAARIKDYGVRRVEMTVGSDGNEYFPGMLPRDVKDSGETRVHWAHVSSEGTTTGARYPTEAAALAASKDISDEGVNRFYETLQGMDDQQVKDQSNYWLKAQSLFKPPAPVFVAPDWWKLDHATDGDTYRIYHDKRTKIADRTYSIYDTRKPLDQSRVDTDRDLSRLIGRADRTEQADIAQTIDLSAPEKMTELQRSALTFDQFRAIEKTPTPLWEMTQAEAWKAVTNGRLSVNDALGQSSDVLAYTLYTGGNNNLIAQEKLPAIINSAHSLAVIEAWDAGELVPEHVLKEVYNTIPERPVEVAPAAGGPVPNVGFVNADTRIIGFYPEISQMQSGLNMSRNRLNSKKGAAGQKLSASELDATRRNISEIEQELTRLKQETVKRDGVSIVADEDRPAEVAPIAPTAPTKRVDSLIPGLIEHFTNDTLPATNKEMEVWAKSILPDFTVVNPQHLQELYDGMEGAFNVYLKRKLNGVKDLGERIEIARVAEEKLVQARRTTEKRTLQQFSTPSTISEAAMFAADIRPGDVVQEPTAGTGNLVLTADRFRPGEIRVNELDAVRRDVLTAQGYDPTGTNVLGREWVLDANGKRIPADVDVDIENPPWGAYSKGNYGTPMQIGYTTRNGDSTNFMPNDWSQHFFAAIDKRRKEGSRVSAVMPNNMIYTRNRTTGVRSEAGREFRTYLKETGYLRAIIESPAGAYSQRATDVSSILLVWDKTQPPDGALPAIEAWGSNAPKTWAEYTKLVEQLGEGGTHARPQEALDAITNSRRPATGPDATGLVDPAALEPGRKPIVAAIGKPASQPKPGRAGAGGRATGVDAIRTTGGVAPSVPPLRGQGNEPNAISPAAPVVGEPTAAAVAGVVGGVAEPAAVAGSRRLAVGEPGRGAGEFVNGPDRNRVLAAIPGNAERVRIGNLDVAKAEHTPEFSTRLEAQRSDSQRSDGFVEYSPRTALVNEHPSLVVEARSLTGVAYPDLEAQYAPHPAIFDAASRRALSTEGNIDPIWAAIQQNEKNNSGILIADDVGMGKARTLGGYVIDKVMKGKKRILVVTSGEQNITNLQAEMPNIWAGVASDTGGWTQGSNEFPAQFIHLTGKNFPEAKAGDVPLPKFDTPTIYLVDENNITPFEKAILDLNVETVVIDEVHKFKNLGSARGGTWQRLHEQWLGNNSDFLYLSATPAADIADLEYLYGLRLWRPDGFSDWKDIILGHRSAADVQQEANIRDSLNTYEKTLTAAVERVAVGGEDEVQVIGRYGMEARVATPVQGSGLVIAKNPMNGRQAIIRASDGLTLVEYPSRSKAILVADTLKSQGEWTGSGILSTEQKRIIEQAGNTFDATYPSPVTRSDLVSIGITESTDAAQVVDNASGKKGWGSKRGSAFESTVSPAHTEQIMRELKAGGYYMSRDIWRGGVDFDAVEVAIPPEKIAFYRQRVKLYQKLFDAFTRFSSANKGANKTSALFGVTGKIQQDGRRVLFDMRLPGIMEEADKAIAAGQKVVISVISVSELKTEGGSLPVAIRLINDVKVDNLGHGAFSAPEDIPEALILKTELQEALVEMGGLPNPVDVLSQKYGDRIAFISGQTKPADRIKAQERFQAGEIDVIMISKAGKTGINLHDVTGDKRVHLIVGDYEWSSTDFKQELGRVDRTGQLSSPAVSLMHTGSAGELRFTSSIANRMRGLGATSKGGAETASVATADFELGANMVDKTALTVLWSQLPADDRRLFLDHYFWDRFEVGYGKNKTFEYRPKPTILPTAETVKKFLNSIMMIDPDKGKEITAKFQETRALVKASDANIEDAALLTARLTGEVLRTTPIGKGMHVAEVKTAAGKMEGIVYGILTPAMNQINTAVHSGSPSSEAWMRWARFTTDDGEIISGLTFGPDQTKRVLASFGATQRGHTSESALPDMRAGDKLKIYGDKLSEWELYLGKGGNRDGLIIINGAKMSQRDALMRNGAQLVSAGNFWHIPEDKLPAFLERFKLRDEATSEGNTQTPLYQLSQRTPSEASAPAIPQTAEAMPAPKMGIPDAKGIVGDSTYAYGITDSTKRYEFKWRLVSLDDVIASNDSTGGVNPAYNQTLQGRDRTDAASRMQVQEIYNKFNPLLYLDDGRALDRGAPIIGTDMMVESGNGRTLALRMVFDNKPAEYEDYVAQLASRAPDYGFNPRQVMDMEKPVLVRERVTNVDRVDFADEANVRSTSAMNAVEMAQRDARRIPQSMVDNLYVGKSQTLEQALRSPENISVKRAFVDSRPQNELKELAETNGELSQNGIRRLTAALFARTYPGDAGTRLVRAIFDSADEDIKRISAGLLMSLGDVARAESLIAGGTRYPGLSIAGDVAIAVDKMSTLRSEGTSVGFYLKKQALFERELTPFQEQVLTTLDKYKRSGRKIGELLKDYARRVDDAGDPNNTTMFAMDTPRKEVLFGLSDDAMSKVEFEAVTPIAVNAELAAPPTKPAPVQIYERAIGEPIPTSEGTKVVKKVTNKAITVENSDGTTTDIPIIRKGDMPLPPGITNDAGMMPTPYASAALETWQKQTRPALDMLQRNMIDGLNNQRYTKTGSALDDTTRNDLNGWLDKQYGNMASVNLGAMKWGEYLRDAALLNYSRRYKYNSLLGLVFPYEFWMTHSIRKWALHSIDKPSLLANYFRVQKFLETEVTKEGTPSRLKGRLRLPLPFMPEWMGGGIFIDPLKIGFPLQNFVYPWESWQEGGAQLEDATTQVLTDYFDSGDYEAADVQKAIDTKAGSLWDQAKAEAIAADPNLDKGPLDLVTSVLSPHLPLTMAYNALNGHPERNNPVPLTRYARAISNAVGMGDDLVNGVTKAVGLPVFDQWNDYRIDRYLSDLAAEGFITADDAKQAMISRSGKAFDLAVAREAEANVWTTFGGGLLGSGVGILPEGEKTQRTNALKYKLFKAVYDAEQNGNVSPMVAFLKENPAYEARLALYDNPEERIRNFLIDKVWSRWELMPRVYKQDLQQALGSEFQTSFLDKVTRDYEAIPIDELARWARTMGTMIPGDPKVKPMPVQWSSPATAAAVEAYYNDRQTLFDWPTVSKELSDYYDLSDSGETVTYQSGVYKTKAKKGQPKYTTVKKSSIFLDQHPDLQSYFDWSKAAKAKNAGIQAYIDENALTYGNDVQYSDSQWADLGYILPQELAPIAQAWIFSGRKPSATSMKTLTAAWEQAGKPNANVQQWLLQELSMQ